MKKIANLKEAIDYLKSSVDITKVVAEITPVQQAGADLFKAVCCFHEEKTPSFTMTPSRGLYHCFGCKASGDIVTFYKAQYGMDTTEAIRAIAKKYDISISQFERELTEEEKQLIEYQNINQEVKEMATRNLIGGGTGYLEERDINEDTILAFGLGYTADNIEILKSVSGPMAQLLEFDKPPMWRDAVIYPLHDAWGGVIGFKTRPSWDGQTVDQRGAKLPKFMGTSSHSPLHSDTHIYGFHIARKHMVNGRLYAVEGQHDVLSAFQKEIKNTIGTDGTAFNSDKLKQLEEFGVREVVLMYDGDSAGREASLKLAKDVADMNTTVSFKIASMPEGLDPDEMLRTQGRLAFLQVAYEAVYASQYLVDNMLRTANVMNVTGKIDFVKNIQPMLSKAPEAERPFLMLYVAEKIGVDLSVIEDVLRAEHAKKSKSLLYNIEGERVVLGQMLRDEDFRLQTFTEMKQDDFFVAKNGYLFEMLSEMGTAGVPISPETLKATMNNKAYNILFGEGSFIDDIYAVVGNAQVMKEDIIDKAQRRKLIGFADKLKDAAADLKERTVLVVEDHMEKIQRSIENTTNTALGAKQGAKEFMAKLMDRMKNPNQITGIELGHAFKNVTAVLNGINKKKLIVIAANQSVGKTTLLCNWLAEISVKQKRPWCHFSLEMPKEEMVTKIIGILANVNTQKIEKGNLTNEEFSRVQMATIAYHESGLTIIDDQRTLEAIMNTTRRMIRTDRIEGMSIDYIQLMSVERNRSKQRYEELGDISGGLKTDIANNLALPVIVLSQLSKAAINAEVAKAEDGSGSYKIAQDADIYITLKEKSLEEIQTYGIENGNIVLNIDKNRGGQADVLLDVLFQRDIQLMMETKSAA